MATKNFPRPLVNADTTVLTLAAEAAGTVNSADQINASGRGVIIHVDLTILTNLGTETFDLKVQGKDVASGSYYDLPGCEIAQLTAAGSATLAIHPGIASETANVSIAFPVPRKWRVQVVIADAAATATVGACVMI